MKLLLAIFLLNFTLTAVSHASTDKEAMTNPETTPLKVLCRYEGGNHQLLVQFVKDKQAEPGIYSVVNGKFYPGNKITKVSYELYGESYSKVGRLDNGGKVRLYISVDGQEMVGTVDKTDAFFGEGATLYGCEDIKLK